MMEKQVYNLGNLSWRLSGFMPFSWKFNTSMETGVPLKAEINKIDAPVPGSVQQALLKAGHIPDWNYELNAKACEWIENRHWIFETVLPDDWLKKDVKTKLKCLGLDEKGWIYLNGKEIAQFGNALVPHVFDLTEHLRPSNNFLQIIFDCPPRWLGQIGYSNQMRDWKPRFNYFWDWIPRLVQIGIWDEISLEVIEEGSIESCRALTSFNSVESQGTFFVQGDASGGQVVLNLTDEDGGNLFTTTISSKDLSAGFFSPEIKVEPWFPNIVGEQKLYFLRIDLVNDKEEILDSWEKKVGFKEITWEPCFNAPLEATPWICHINGKRIFLQGVNWTPVLPNFADVSAEERHSLLETYQEIGCNMLRVWGGAFLPPESFFDSCDQLGLMIWQDFPFSASGLSNHPPRDKEFLTEMEPIIESYIVSRQHHACLFQWCGGNELMDDDFPGQKPLTAKDEPVKTMKRIVERLDPDRRFVPCSASGPSFMAKAADFGKGLHWDVHGPWICSGELKTEWNPYWASDDALFRSETGCPGTSSLDILEEYAGEMPLMPGTAENPLWQRFIWWIEWGVFKEIEGREPENIAEYVQWSQQRQADALGTAVGETQKRFPEIGGIIIWMGHDCFPCMANTSIIDFHGRLKPAGEVIKQNFLNFAENGFLIK